MQDAKYYDALKSLVGRYKSMAFDIKDYTLVEFIREFDEAIWARLSLMKLNRWLGYIQGTLIAAGATTVEAERDFTRPIFRPLDFPLDFPTEQGYTVISKIGEDYVDLQRQRAERSGCPDQGRPNEGVSATLRELSLPSVYRQAINRPERAWSGFARTDHMRTKTCLPQTRSQQRRASKGYPSS